MAQAQGRPRQLARLVLLLDEPGRLRQAGRPARRRADRLAGGPRLQRRRAGDRPGPRLCRQRVPGHVRTEHRPRGGRLSSMAPARQLGQGRYPQALWRRSGHRLRARHRDRHQPARTVELLLGEPAGTRRLSMPPGEWFRVLEAHARTGGAGASGRIPVDRAADLAPRAWCVRRPGRQALRGAALRQRRSVVVQDGLWRPDLRARVRVGRTDLLRLRGRVSVRAGAGSRPAAPREGSRGVEDSQPAYRQACRSQVRLVHQPRRSGQHQCQRSGGQAALPDQVDPPLRGHLQAPARLRRRPDVHPYGRRANLRRGAGVRPAVVAPLLARRAPLVHRAALLQGASPATPGGDEEVAPTLPRRQDRQAHLGSPLHRLAELEPAGATGRLQEPGHLHVRLGQLLPSGNRQGLPAQGHT